jgi:hypothetical protein
MTWVPKTNLRGEQGLQGKEGPRGGGGLQGEPGPANELAIGRVNAGPTAAAHIRGTAPRQVIDFTVPRGPQGLPGAGAVPADTAVAGYVATDGDSETQAALDGRFAPRGELDYNSFSRAYRKRIARVLPFVHPEYATVRALTGDTYPQSFAFDLESDEIYVLYQNDFWHSIAVYQWSTGAYKSVFSYECAFVSEGMAVVWEGPKRYLYTRYWEKGLGKFDITVLPASLTVVIPESTLDTDQGRNFAYRDGYWTVSDRSTAVAWYVNRGAFKRLTKDLALDGLVSIPEILAGGNAFKYSDNSLPKMQGIADGGGYYVLGMGGYAGRGKAVTPYGYQGIRVFTAQGAQLVDNLLDPERMMDILVANGLHPNRVESEGVQFAGGKLYSICVTSSFDKPDNITEGVVIFEEFSDAPDAVDFSPAAVVATAPDTRLLQSGLHPLQVDNTLRNPVTNAVMDSLPKIMEYMKAVNQTEFKFYSSMVSVKDASGVPFAANNIVHVRSANNATFIVAELGGNKNRWSRVYPSTVAGEFTTVYDDTGWLNINLSAGIVAWDAGTVPQYRWKQGVTYLRGGLKGLAGAPSSTTVGSFPAEFADTASVNAVQRTSNNSVAAWRIGFDGVIVLESTTNPSPNSGSWYPLPAVSFVSKD